jgi:hypothetical protein
MKLLTQDEINDVYYQYVAINNTDEYNQRYTTLPKSTIEWQWDNKDFPRVIIVLEFLRMVQKYNLHSETMLIFNNYDDPELQCIPTRGQIFTNNYQDGLDLHMFKPSLKQHDFAILSQTIEHLYNPYLCLENIRRSLMDGAYIFCSVPVVNILHNANDTMMTGMSPLGLGCMFRSCGFKLIEIGQWGTNEYINFIFKNHYWPSYNHISSYVNEFNNPVQTWVLAIKE